MFIELVGKVKFSTVMSDFHQKLSRIEALKIDKNFSFSFQTFTDNITKVCYTKVY